MKLLCLQYATGNKHINMEFLKDDLLKLMSNILKVVH